MDNDQKKYKGQYNQILLYLRKIAEYLAFFDIYTLSSETDVKKKIGATIIPYSEKGGEKKFLPPNSEQNIWTKCVITNDQNKKSINALYILIQTYYLFLEQWFEQYKQKYGNLGKKSKPIKITNRKRKNVESDEDEDDENDQIEEKSELDLDKRRQLNRRVTLLLKILYAKDGLNSGNRKGDDDILLAELRKAKVTEEAIKKLEKIDSIPHLFYEWKSSKKENSMANVQIHAIKQIFSIFSSVNDSYLKQDVRHTILENDELFHVFSEFLLLSPKDKIKVAWSGFRTVQASSKLYTSYGKYLYGQSFGSKSNFDNTKIVSSENFKLLLNGLKKSLTSGAYKSCKGSENINDYDYLSIENNKKMKGKRRSTKKKSTKKTSKRKISKKRKIH